MRAVLLLLAPAELALAEPPLPNIPTNVYSVLNFGAYGDGISNNASAISNTINAAAVTGGTVEIPANGTLSTYLCGPISLKNNINLQIDGGATLKMLPFGSYPTNPSPPDFISAKNLHDIELSGSGTIEGQGGPWWAAYENNGIARPKAMFAPDGCKTVLVQNVTMQNPPNTHISIRNASVNVTVRGIIINTTSDVISDNTDGIDVNATNCLIRNCYIYCGDDHVAIGGGSAVVTITNCTFGAGHGVSIGSTTKGGVHDLIVSNCTMIIPPDGSLSSGIRGKSARDRGGLVQYLAYSDMVLTNVQNPIFISSYYPDSTIPSNPALDSGSSVTVTTPIWRTISISNVTAFAASGHNAGRIYGLPEMLISNVTLSKVIAKGDLSFDMYNIQAIQFVDSQINVPSTTNTLNLYNVQLTITNSVLNTNLVKIGGWTSSHATNQLSLFNASVAITDTNIFKIAKPTTLGGGTLSFTQSSASLSDDINVVSASTLQFTRGTNTLGGALSGPGPLTLALTNGNIMAVLQGNAAGFTGVLALSSNGTLRLDQGVNVWGGANAAFDAGPIGIINNHAAGNITVFLGALSGGSGARLLGSDQAGPGVDTYVIGGLNSNTTFAGVITNGTGAGLPHTVALTKIGSGTFILSGANGYSGGTTVSNGTLVVNNTTGSGTGAGAVTVVARAALGGGGIMAGPVTVDGTLAPGNGPGTLTVSNNVVLNSDAILQYDLGSNSDLTVAADNLTLDGTLDITDGGGFTNATYTLFTYGGMLVTNGSPAILAIGSTPDTNKTYTIDISTAGQVNLLVSDATSPPLDPFVAWQLQYFGCTNLAICPQAAGDADYDGDGMNNTNEFLTGTDPTNSASAFRIISASQQTTDVTITWSTAGGRTNVVQGTSGAVDGRYTTNFTDLSTPMAIPGNGDVTTNYTDSGGATNVPSRYYRIHLVP